MSLFERGAFEALISSLPAVEIVHQWGDASVGKVGGKIFAILSFWDGEGTKIGFKCSDMSFRMLPELEGVQKAKYLARAKWVQVSEESELSEADIEAYVRAAHQIIAAKLPKKTKLALGLGAD
jgi:predicted DNA-binding protein (MmcQ/YjbR family)